VVSRLRGESRKAPWTIEESAWLVGSVDNRGIGVDSSLRGQSRNRRG